MHTQVVEDDAPLPSCKHHSPEFVDLIKQCLEKDPYRRPTAESLIAHPFLQKVACAVVPSLCLPWLVPTLQYSSAYLCLSVWYRPAAPCLFSGLVDRTETAFTHSR